MIGYILTQLEVLFNRITENKKLSKFVAPKNKSYLTAEITYTNGDKFSKINPSIVMKKSKIKLK